MRTTERQRAGRTLLAAAVTLSMLAGCSTAPDAYPTRPIQLISPWAVGGGTDRLARQVARFLEEDLHVPVVVINATGGAGVTGHSRGANARPDGYTLTMMTVEINMLHWRGLTNIGSEDFEPVALINRDPAAVFVRADDTRFRNFEEVLTSARGDSDELTASGAASGGIWHLALAGALNAAGMLPDQIRWIPTNGAAPALQELISGGIDLVVCSVPEARSFLVAGRVRSLGLMASERLAEHPSIPTLIEGGLDWTMGSWRGLGLPNSTAAARLDRLANAIARIVAGEVSVNDTRFPDVLSNEGFTLQFEDPQQFRTSLTRSDSELGALLTSPAFSSLHTGPFDAMGFPKLIIGALCVALLVLAVGRSGGRAPSTATVPARAELVPAAEVVFAVAIYALLAEVIGFVILGIVILAVLLRRTGNRWVPSLAVSGLLVPTVYTVFSTLLRVPLPRGVFGW